MKKRIVWIVFWLILAVITGFVQERLKVNVNYLIENGDKMNGFFDQSAETKREWLEFSKIDAPYDYYHNHGRLEFLLNFSRKQLTILKWAITVIFVGVFLVINAYLLKGLTGSRDLLIWCVRLYLIFFALSFGIYLFGVLTGSATQAYGISRKIVGGLQSLIPFMILMSGYWLNKSHFLNMKK